MILSGTVAFESLVLGDVSSGKIGYTPDRAYQIQSGLNHLAIASTALLVFVLNWGRYADATLVVVSLSVFILSAANHVMTALRENNMKTANLMRPVLALLLAGVLIPPMVRALIQNN
jgi:hypothetical protein